MPERRNAKLTIDPRLQKLATSYMEAQHLPEGAVVMIDVATGNVLAYGCLVAGSGIGGVAVLAMPYSMQADVIDHDELLTGERREGLYGGLWSIAEKTAAGVGLGLAMLALDLAGYVPNQDQTPLVLGVPCLCTAVGFVIAMRYPLDREAHRAMKDKLTELAERA